MFFGFFRRACRRSKKRSSGRERKLRMEPLEDRSMLAVMADVVFLVDESSSAGMASVGT